jgi:hypothetical protein
MKRGLGKGGGFSFVAPKPALSGAPGERVAACVDATVIQRGDKRDNRAQVLLTFEFENGEMGKIWVEVKDPLSATCRYMHLVRLALGGDPAAGTPLHPKNVFEGKIFRVFVGYRKSASPRGKGKLADELAHTRKDDQDFLRIHDLLEHLESRESLQTHMGYGSNGSTDSDTDSDRWQ